MIGWEGTSSERICVSSGSEWLCICECVWSLFFSYLFSIHNKLRRRKMQSFELLLFHRIGSRTIDYFRFQHLLACGLNFVKRRRLFIILAFERSRLYWAVQSGTYVMQSFLLASSFSIEMRWCVDRRRIWKAVLVCKSKYLAVEGW